MITLAIICIDNKGQNGPMIFNILNNTTELWMTKYIIGEIFSSGEASLYKNPSDQTVYLQDLGLDDLGYEFLTIDDQWHLPNRDAVTNRMIANPEKFPSGIRFLADFMHERGLKLGIYSSAGRYTCSCNLPGSLEFEEIDVQMMLDFEIDYFKVDFKLQ